MAEANRTLLIPASTGTRVLFAVVCLLGSLGGVLAALAYELRLGLTLAPEERAAAGYDWARPANGRLLGARLESGLAILEAWPANAEGASTPARLWTHDARTRPLWASDPGGAWVAWASPDGIRSRLLSDGAPEETRLAEFRGKTAVHVTALPGTVAVIFSDGSARSFDAATLDQQTESRVPAASAEQWTGEGHWAGIWRQRASTVELFEANSSGAWVPRGTVSLPAGSRPHVSAHGAVIGISGNRVWKDGQWHRAPGVVRSAAVRRFGGIVATGDFDGVYLLRGEEQPEKLASCQPRSAVAIAGARLIVTGGAETASYRIRGYELFTERGRLFVYGSGILFAALSLYLLALFARLGAKMWREKGGISFGGGAPAFVNSSTPPPTALVEAFRTHGAVLWAGSGLSAQAGHPTWDQLLDKLEQTAADEDWYPAKVRQEIRQARNRGDDEALEQIVHRMYERRARMVEFVCNIYGLPAQLSKAHYALYRLPFRACITTNYDNLLERLGPDWNARLFTANSRGYVSAFEAGKFFLLKLYGDLRDADTIKLCPSELYSAAESWGILGETLHGLFEKNTFLFVGVSPERLLADLRNLGFPPSSEIRHWVVTGVAGRRWSAAARDLREEFGVQVIPFRDRDVAAEMPPWLDQLAKLAAPPKKASPNADPWYVESKVS